METAAPDVGTWMQTLASLALVVALIFALSWLLRRAAGLRGPRHAALQVRAALAVGQRERVLWVQAGNTHLLLGVSPGRVQTLHVFSEAPLDEATPSPVAAPDASALSRFAQLLKP